MFTVRNTPALSQPKGALAIKLRHYFYSGWAFLLPYLAVYLLYYVTKWPVNASRPMENGELRIQNGWVPCMLHVYWALHVIHVILAGFALWSWWKQNRVLQEETERTEEALGHSSTEGDKLRRREHGGTDPVLLAPTCDNQWFKTGPENLTTDCTDKHGLESNSQEADPPLAPGAGVSGPLDVERSALSVERSYSPALKPPTSRFNWSSTLTALAPWLLLALLFYIPGVYLEWPSDPWEHLRRINEWRILDTVGAHSSWMKSAYFIPYSMLSWCIGLRQLFWLDFYYTGICLLLCWQYYRFSRACGLGERASMVFVIIQALLFGNNIFSFYRYYGISSSIYAQLGAIALTRIVLEFAARGTKLEAAGQTTDTGSVSQRQRSSDTEATEPKHTATQVGESRSEEGLMGLESSQARARQPFSLLVLVSGLRALCVRALCTLWRKTSVEKDLTTDCTDQPGLTPVQTGNQPDLFNAKNTKDDLQTQRSENKNCSLPATRSPLLPSTPLVHETGAAGPLNVERSALGVERSSVADFQPFSLSALRPCLLPLITAVTCLLALTTMNHPQGIGIAGLGIAAVIVWRLIEWKRSALWWLIGGTIVVNALFLWLYPRPAIIETYRAENWLNAWYGFNLFHLSSPAADRAMQILSVFGVLSLAVTPLIGRSNRVVASLTLLPFLTLLVPLAAIPFSELTHRASGFTGIVTFQRMLFGIPAGLALVTYMTKLASNASKKSDYRFCTTVATISALLLLTGLVSFPPTSSYNRTWSVTSITPDDLKLLDVVRTAEAAKQSREISKAVGPQVGAAMESLHTVLPVGPEILRTIGAPTVNAAVRAIDFLGIDDTNEQAPPEPANPAVGAYFSSCENDPHQTWITVGGQDAEFLKSEGSVAFSPIVQNPIGASSDVLSSRFTAISRSKSYQLEMSVRQLHDTQATAYLAIAWYNAAGVLLESYATPPRGAGNPRGWHNGTYSYFGLVSQPPPPTWTQFGVSFGAGQPASIPAGAKYVRVGALLNFNSSRRGVVQIRDVTLNEIPVPEIRVVPSGRTAVFSPASQAAVLSGHWPVHQLFVDRAGMVEIKFAARETGKSRVH